MYGPSGYGAPPMPQQQGSGQAVAGLILGIVSIPAAFALCGVIFGILGIVFSVLGRRSIEYRTMANIGLVLSIIGIACAIAFGAYDVMRVLNDPSLLGVP
jgi:protein-S-isoprenylcysteine O-methyltransferase Ste14